MFKDSLSRQFLMENPRGASNTSKTFVFRDTRTHNNTSVRKIRRRPFAKNPIASGIFDEPSAAILPLSLRLQKRERSRDRRSIVSQNELASVRVSTTESTQRWIIYFGKKDFA